MENLNNVDGRQSARTSHIQRGVCRMLLRYGFTPLCEVTLANGRRADVVALSEKGDLWIVEIKSSIEDFRADQKWPEYDEYCDKFYFATSSEVPIEIFPEDEGLIIADQFGGEILRDASEDRLNAARRKALLLRFAHVAGRRAHAQIDPTAKLHDV